MVVFGLELEKPSLKSDKFFYDVRTKLLNNGLVKNPFKGTIHTLGKGFHIVDITPVYPNPLVIGVLLFMVGFVLWGVTWALLPGIILMNMTVFWSRWFYYLIIILGLKKTRVKGKVKLLKDQDTLKRLVK